MSTPPPIRFARPTNRLEDIAAMYQEGLGFKILSTFKDHEGFDGVILGVPGAQYHLEFTHHHGQTVPIAPTQEHIIVLYVPNEADWKRSCERMKTAGFSHVRSYNPYWDREGMTFEDIEGYRVVIQGSQWP